VPLKHIKAHFFPDIRGMSKTNTYLDRLPKHAQKRGSVKRGEAEIVTAKRELDEIASECAGDLKGSALGSNGKRIGILLEDDVRFVIRDALKFPSGTTECRMRVVGKTEFDGPNGVVALCVMNGRFVIREIYRHATRGWELEVVRGRRESGQTARQAVRAEVKQELGFGVKRMRRIGVICPDTALMSSTLEVYLVELRDGPQRDEPESSEIFGETYWLTYPELAAMIRRGAIRDSYTIAALTFARLHGHVRESRAR